MSAIHRLRSHAEHQGRLETAAAHKRLARGEDPVKVVEALSLGLTRKLLHPPMHGFNRAAGAGSEGLMQSLVRLYLD